MKRNKSIVNVGLVVLLGLSAGLLAHHTRATANPPDPAPDVDCNDKCSMAQFVKYCSDGKYYYFTKSTCVMCGFGGKWNCVARVTNGNPTCTQSKTDTMKSKVIMSFELCACKDAKGNPYDTAEAKTVDPGEVTGDPIPRWSCVD